MDEYHGLSYKELCLGEGKEGICNKTCGGGSRTDERTKIKPEQNGGTCLGKPKRVVDCNPQKCLGNIFFQLFLSTI